MSIVLCHFTVDTLFELVFLLQSISYISIQPLYNSTSSKQTDTTDYRYISTTSTPRDLLNPVSESRPLPTSAQTVSRYNTIKNNKISRVRPFHVILVGTTDFFISLLNFP